MHTGWWDANKYTPSTHKWHLVNYPAVSLPIHTHTHRHTYPQCATNEQMHAHSTLITAIIFTHTHQKSRATSPNTKYTVERPTDKSTACRRVTRIQNRSINAQTVVVCVVVGSGTGGGFIFCFYSPAYFAEIYLLRAHPLNGCLKSVTAIWMCAESFHVIGGGGGFTEAKCVPFFVCSTPLRVACAHLGWRLSGIFVRRSIKAYSNNGT